MTYCRRFRVGPRPKPTPKRGIEKPKQPQRDRYGGLTDERNWKGARSKMARASRRRNQLRSKSGYRGVPPIRVAGRLQPRRSR